MSSDEDDGLLSTVKTTIAEVDGLGLSVEDRLVVLRTLLAARLGGSAVAPMPPAPNLIGKVEVSRADDGDVMGRLASAFQVSRDVLELVFDVVDNAPSVVVSAKKVASNKSQAARQLGQLIAAARQIAGVEEWTSAATIRKVVQDYGRLDVSNFAASLQQMDDVAVLRGKGAQREIKITKPGIESTADLIRAITGEA